MAITFLVPGTTDTDLTGIIGGRRKKLWYDSAATAIQYLGSLALGDDGITPNAIPPFPSATSIRPADTPSAGTPLNALLANWNQEQSVPRWFGYDWRLDIRNTAANLATAVKQVIQQDGQDVYLVGHSMGGLLIRFACSYLATPVLAKIKKIVYICTPHGGSLQAIRVLSDIGEFINGDQQLLELFMAIAGALPFTPLLKFGINGLIKAIISTLPSVYQLLPNCFDVNSFWPNPLLGQLMGNTGIWTMQNSYFRPALRDAAIVTWNQLNSLLVQPRPSEVCVIGTGFPTETDIGSEAQTRENGFNNWTFGDGDGVVPTKSAFLPSAGLTINLPGLRHQTAPADERVTANIQAWLTGDSTVTQTVPQTPSEPDLFVVGSRSPNATPIGYTWDPRPVGSRMGQEMKFDP